MKKGAFFILMFVFAAACKQRFTPPDTSPKTGYLVAEGFINYGSEPTAVSLSRTTQLADAGGIVPEHNAQVSIEANDNESFPMDETGNGLYTSAPLALNSALQYRLRIVTLGGKEYVSDFSPVKNTPAIDSISWQRDDAEVKFFIDTHDAANNTKYYQWLYDETWEFHSTYNSSLFYTNDAATGQTTGVDYRFSNHTQDASIYKCWKSAHSDRILIGSSEKLTADRIHLPLYNIEKGTQQISELYSVNVKQHALSAAGYRFLEKMKKNTEQLGSIFDAQPSELRGNIHCLTNPAEQVIGYMEVSQQQEQRIFISRDNVPNWNYRPACKEIIIVNNMDSISKYGLGLLPTTVAASTFFSITSFGAANPSCVDCTLTGSNIKPDFWP